MMRISKVWSLFCVGLCCFCCEQCSKPVVEQEKESEEEQPVVVSDLSDIQSRGILRAITMEGAFSYYVGNTDDEMGFDYDLAMNLADYLDVDLQLIVAENMTDMIDKLRRGEGDLIAYRLPTTAEYKSKYAFVDKHFPSEQVLVQRKGKKQISDVTQLIGKRIYVHPKSTYEKRLQNLNDELGGGIEIVEVDDTVTQDQLIIGVSKGQYEYTVVDNDMVELAALYLRNLDYSVSVGLSTYKGWMMRRSSPELLASVNEWFSSIENSRFLKNLTRQYVQTNSFYRGFKVYVPKGHISPFDDIFQKHATKLGWDWRLLAALAYHESHFNSQAVSRMGAMGLMQMMPRTASKYGLNEKTILIPEFAISAGVEYLKRLDMIFKRVEDDSERQKFVLAGYNAGPGHILDAMALAEKYGDNPNVWYGHVEKYLLLKNEPEYYNDPVVRNGFFRGKHTSRYVDEVMQTYQRYMGH